VPPRDHAAGTPLSRMPPAEHRVVQPRTTRCGHDRRRNPAAQRGPRWVWCGARRLGVWAWSGRPGPGVQATDGWRSVAACVAPGRGHRPRWPTGLPPRPLGDGAPSPDGAPCEPWPWAGSSCWPHLATSVRAAGGPSCPPGDAGGGHAARGDSATVRSSSHGTAPCVGGAQNRRHGGARRPAQSAHHGCLRCESGRGGRGTARAGPTARPVEAPAAHGAPHPPRGS
jgi:hypothetical protein